MKTPDIKNTNQKLNRMREGIRLSIIVVGIVTAILGSLALLYEAQPAESYGSANQLIETSKIVATDFSIEVASRAVVSAIWP